MNYIRIHNQATDIHVHVHVDMSYNTVAVGSLHVCACTACIAYSTYTCTCTVCNIPTNCCVMLVPSSVYVLPCAWMIGDACLEFLLSKSHMFSRRSQYYTCAEMTEVELVLVHAHPMSTCMSSRSAFGLIR